MFLCERKMTKSMFHNLNTYNIHSLVFDHCMKPICFGFYQSNQSVSVEDEIMLCSVDIADKSMHSFDLEGRRYDEDV